MKKIFYLLFIFLGLLTPSLADDFGIEGLNLRPSKTVFLPKGTFIKVTNLQDFSSQYLDEGDEIQMVSTFDVFVGETKLIPQKSVFIGTVEKIREPVQGTNASISIRINKFITPDGIPYAIDGYVSSNGSDTFIGGGITPPLYYVRMPHYTRWKYNKWKIGVGQYCETNTREFGVHTTVKSGAELFVILQNNLDLLQ